MKRISKIAVELNVSSNTLIQELKKLSDKEFHLNSKLDTKEINYLTEIFQKDRDEKIEANKRKATFYFDIDEDFSFPDLEKNDLPELFSEYEKNLSDIDQLKNRVNRFGALEDEEINILLKSKFKKIFEIQKVVKEERRLRIIANSNHSNQDPYDPYENFHWGGLSGEEAHTAYWNCD